MKQSCNNCRYAVLKDFGYSNYTVEGTEFSCAIQLHPDGSFDRWYGQDARLNWGSECAGVHAFIVGTAIFGANVRFQPSTTTSVIAGSIVENIIQGSGSITMINGSGGGGGGTSFLKNSQGHIVYAEYPSGTLVAVADVTDVNASFVTVKVIVLLPNWTISGLWIVE